MHNKGIIHRDLKPENILIDDDNLPRITDFGICYRADADERLTEVLEAVGSRYYMAPELEDGRVDDVGKEVDVYALGKIAYWLFSNGDIYSREKHRDWEYDLTRAAKQEHWRYYFNDWLDKATATVPTSRFLTIDNLEVNFNLIADSILTNLRYLDFKLDQPCSFCGIGKYRRVVTRDIPNYANRNSLENFHLKPSGSPAMAILCCDRCGHVQMFNKTEALQWEWK